MYMFKFVIKIDIFIMFIMFTNYVIMCIIVMYMIVNIIV